MKAGLTFYGCMFSPWFLMRDDGSKCKYQTHKPPMIDLSALISILVMVEQSSFFNKVNSCTGNDYGFDF